MDPYTPERNKLYFRTQGGDIDQMKDLLEEICGEGEYELEVLYPVFPFRLTPTISIKRG